MSLLLQERLRGLPIWKLAVTNNGRAPAKWWYPVLAVKNGEHVKLGAISFQLLPFVPLPPGQWTNITIIMPSDIPSVWAVAVRYDSSPSPLEKRLDSLLKPVPVLRHLLPNSNS